MKISVVGCGKVGSAVAYTALLKGLTDDIVLVDASCDKARGEALDILQCRPFAPQASVRQGQMADTAGSDIIVITAGIPRKADEPRVLLLSRNAALIGDIVRQAVRYSPNCILFMITNPLDVMTQLAFKVSGLPRERVIGMGTVLDTSRYRACIARDFAADARDIDAYVIGEHGETMVPVKTGIRIRGIPLEQWPGFSAEKLVQVVNEVIAASGQVIALKGGTVFAPAVSACAVLEALVRNSQAVLPVCTYQEDLGICVSLPTIINREGAKQVVGLPISSEEDSLFAKSVENIRSYVKDLTEYL
jgi:L-lactate dehydrogenase